MDILSIVKVELVKWYHKRISLLLVLLFIPTVLFGVGMRLDLSFFVSDGGDGGVDALGSSLSALGFAVNMMTQAEYILFLVVIIFAAVTLAGELEYGQMKSEIIRICDRGKILLAKYMALLLLIYGTVILSLFWSVFFYLVLLRGNGLASGKIFDDLAQTQMEYIVFKMIGIAVVTAVTFVIGTCLKTFPSFAISYILWFASLYTQFAERIRLLIPYNMPDYILENGSGNINLISYIGIYIGYCVCLLLVSGVVLKKSDIKS